MRDVNLKGWKPDRESVYYAHVSSSLEASGVGLVVIRVDTGRKPCCGVDSDPQDGYSGDVLRDDSGYPRPGVTIQYFHRREPREVIFEGETDDEGKHQFWTPAGEYFYRYIDDKGIASEPRAITVEAGRMVRWETVSSEGESQTLAREFPLLIEELVCEWNTSDGEMFLWADVEQTIVEVNNRAGFRYFTFDKLFCKPDLIWSLQGRGVPAWNCELSDLQVAGAYRNAQAIGDAGCLYLSDHANADHQYMRSARYANERRVVAGEGEQKYLADARAIAVHFAAQTSGTEQPQSGFKNKTGLEFLDAATAVQRVEGLFAPQPSTRPLPVVEYSLLGAKK